MKAHGFSGIFRLSILIGAAAFHFANAATPPEQNAHKTPSQQGRQVDQSNKTKNKQNTTANSALKEKQSKNSQSLGSNAQRNNSGRELEVSGSGRHPETGLIATGIGAVLSAIHKPAPSPPAPPPVVAKTTPPEQKTTPHKRTRPKSSDDDVWSRINPVSK